MKTKVRFTQSIAGLKDPLSKEALDSKYQGIRRQMEGLEKPPSKRVIEDKLAALKIEDRYGDPRYGFLADFAFKPDQEATIPTTLAQRWESAGICTILDKVAA